MQGKGAVRNNFFELSKSLVFTKKTHISQANCG